MVIYFKKMIQHQDRLFDSLISAFLFLPENPNRIVFSEVSSVTSAVFGEFSLNLAYKIL
jgi:hypothetical protein